MMADYSHLQKANLVILNHLALIVVYHYHLQYNNLLVKQAYELVALHYQRLDLKVFHRYQFDLVLQK